jgi:hypothetical protein
MTRAEALNMISTEALRAQDWQLFGLAMLNMSVLRIAAALDAAATRARTAEPSTERTR